MGHVLSVEAAPIAAFWRSFRRKRLRPAPKGEACRAEAQAEDGEHGFLASRGMAAPFAPPGEESRAQPLRASAASGPIALMKAGRGRRRGRPLTAAITDSAADRTGAPRLGSGRHLRVRAVHAGTPSA